jgi:hypothetical protein
MSLMKLTFVIDKEYDESFVRNKETLALMESQYSASSKFLEKTRNLYQQAWDEINNQFSEYVKRETGYDWFYPEYECVISVYHKGLSNWGTAPKIVRSWQENPYFARRITAHELVLSHYFEIYKRNYKTEGLSDGQVWALAEIAAYALTSLTDEAKSYWPWASYTDNHSYPHIVELQQNLKDAFVKRKDFDEYMKKGFELVRKYPDMSPTSNLNKSIKSLKDPS